MNASTPSRGIVIELCRFLLVAAAATCFGAEPPRLDFSVKAAVEDGQIIDGHYNLLDPTNRYMTMPVPYRLWLHRGYINVRLASVLSEKLIVAVEPEVRIWFNTYPSSMISGQHTVTPFRQYSYVTIAEGQGTYSFWGNGDPRLRLKIGVFPIKYNPDAMNLGEYLFRTGVYVPYIINKFEYQFGRLSGFSLSSELFGALKQDLLLYTETDIQPLHDWSLSYLIGFSRGAVDVGAGASLHHWLFTDGSTTEPRDAVNGFITKRGDSAYFTFKGIKLMGRGSFDPKRFMPKPIAHKFSTADLRLFIEGAVLGLKDYPAYALGDTLSRRYDPDSTKDYYAGLSQRIPVMFGFNFPTCKLLDYCSLSFEHFAWPNKNVFYREQGKKVYPLPPLNQDTSRYGSDDYRYDSWKWSLNVKKTLVRGFSVIGQVARDHMRHEFWQESQRDDEEIFTRSREWYWMVRLHYAF